MKTKSVYLSVLAVLSILLFNGITATAQKFNNIDPVKYIQLPAENTDYGMADVFILEEKDDANKKLSGAFGKLAGKSDNETVKKGLDAFAKEVLTNKQEKEATWKLIPDNFTGGAGSGKLKVVISYLPDNMAKPMSEPMKNNDGEFVFSYRVNTKMKLYNDMDELIMERDFGAVSGIASSKEWPKNAGGSKAFGISMSKEDEDTEKHPYHQACVDGALEHAQRVVYGMYGVKEFKIPMHVMWAKSEKDTKDVAKDYEDLLEEKEGVVLSTEEMGKMKSLVEQWETLLGNVDKDEKWTVHYNLAAGYGWLVNPEKSKEHIAKVKELNKDIFDKIASSSGSWGTKDLKTLEAYNSLHPFAEYFAAGVKANPGYFKTSGGTSTPGELPYFAPGVSIARSILISKQLGLPAIMPVHPKEFQVDVRKADGVIKGNGQELASLSYSYSKDKFESLKVKGENKFDKLKAEYGIPDNSNAHTQKHRFNNSFGDSKYVGDVHRDSEYEFRYHGKLEVGMPFPMFETDEISQEFGFQKGFGPTFKDRIGQNYGFQNGNMKVTTENGFYKEVAISSTSDFGFVNTIEQEEYKVEVNCKDYKETFTVTEFDKNGYPSKIEANYVLNDAWLYVWAHIKKKFGEETQKESSRQRAANRETEPKAKELIMKLAKSNGATVEKGSTEKYFTLKMTKTYDVSVETNDKGMWTKITIGDYELNREIK